MKNILVTGCAGFIGFSITKFLLTKGMKVVGIDSINNFYSIKLKKSRLAELNKFKNFKFIKDDFFNRKKVLKILKDNKIENIIHLAAQAGVRLSITNPQKYFDNNIVAFYNILESARILKCKKIIFASSSSVYGENKNKKIKENAATAPIQFYATTKVCNEEMAKIYSKIYNIKTIGLRFFTVYGPWGRPDMSYYNFALKILKKDEINLFNNGKHKRDFTYIDDVIKSIYLILIKKPKIDNSNYEIYNIANSRSVPLLDLIAELKKNLQMKIKIKFKKIQVGDVRNTYGSSSKLYKNYDFKPNTSLKNGMENFIKWFKNYHKKANFK